MSTEYLIEPRPDLEEDTNLWSRLLVAAWAVDGELSDGLFGALHGMRCCGAKLEKADQVTISRGEIMQIEFVQLYNRWIQPHQSKLQPLLEAL